MKTMIKILMFLVLMPGGMFFTKAMADPPSEPPPMPSGGHGGSSNSAPGAPIDGGLGILLITGFIVGGIKHYQERHVSHRMKGS